MHIFSLCHTGFGINTNILETNVLNLAVVIYILIPLKDVYVEILEKRTKRIMDVITLSRERYEQSLAKLKKAKIRYAAVKYQAQRIRSRGRIFSKKYSLFLFTTFQERQERILRIRRKKSILFHRQALRSLQSALIKKIFKGVLKNCITIAKDPEEQKLMLEGSLKRFVIVEKRRRKRINDILNS